MSGLSITKTCRLAAIASAIALVASCSAAETSRPQSGPATGGEAESASRPTTREAEGGAATVQALLEAMEVAGKDFQTFEARVLLTERNSLTGEEVPRPGRFWLSRNDDQTRFHVILYGILVEGDGKPLLKPEKTEYLLAGDTLVDRDYRTRTQTTRRLDPEQAQRDMLKLGEGPFPLPVGQSPDAVRKEFTVTLIDPKTVSANNGDIPIYAGTQRLRLVPNTNSPLTGDFAFVEIDVEPGSGLPRQVITLDDAGEQMKITELQEIKIDPQLDPAALELEPIDLSEWNVVAE